MNTEPMPTRGLRKDHSIILAASRSHQQHRSMACTTCPRGHWDLQAQHSSPETSASSSVTSGEQDPQEPVQWVTYTQGPQPLPHNYPHSAHLWVLYTLGTQLVANSHKVHTPMTHLSVQPSTTFSDSTTVSRLHAPAHQVTSQVEIIPFTRILLKTT